MAEADPPARRRFFGARPVGDLVARLLDPVIARKAGMTSGLIAAWPELVGARLEGVTRPERLVWPPKGGRDDPFQPATLVVACEGAAVLRLQHGTSEVIARVNAYFGYPAVSRIKIQQRAVAVRPPSRKPALRPLAPAEAEAAAAMAAGIEDPRLRRALGAYAASMRARGDGTKA